MIAVLELLFCLGVLAIITAMLVASLADAGASTRVVTRAEPITVASNQLPVGFTARCDSAHISATVKSM